MKFLKGLLVVFMALVVMAQGKWQTVIVLLALLYWYDCRRAAKHAKTVTQHQKFLRHINAATYEQRPEEATNANDREFDNLEDEIEDIEGGL